MIHLYHLGVLILVIFSTAVLAGCGAEMGEDVAALVNGRPIKIESLNRSLDAASGFQVSPDYREKVVEMTLNQLIEEELILQEAEKLKIKVTQEELARTAEEIKADYPGQSLEDMLVKEYILMDEWLQSLKRSLLIKKVIDAKVQASLEIDARQLREIYQNHKSELMIPLLVRVDQITCATKKEAEAALRKIRSGHDFNLVAQNYKTEEAESLSKTVGWLDPNQLPPEIGRVILNTKPGQVSEIIESRYGYSIFKVIEIKDAEPMNFEQAEKYLRRLYMIRHETKILTEWVRELKASADIKINPLLHSWYKEGRKKKQQ